MGNPAQQGGALLLRPDADQFKPYPFRPQVFHEQPQMPGMDMEQLDPLAGALDFPEDMEPVSYNFV